MNVPTRSSNRSKYSMFQFPSLTFAGVDFAAIAEDLGVNGYRVTDAEDYRKTLETAVGDSEPALVDVPTKPLPEIDPVPVDWLEPES